MRMPFGAGMIQTVDAADYAAEADVKIGTVYSEGTRMGTLASMIPSLAHSVTPSIDMTHSIITQTIEHEIQI